jgi:hypothetical protein
MSDKFIDFLETIIRDIEDIWCLGPEKIVATPSTGYITLISEKWNGLTNEEQFFFKNKLFPAFSKNHVVLDIFVKPKSLETVNLISFYDKKYLELFSKISGKTTDELFELVANRHNESPDYGYNIDLIRIMFNGYDRDNRDNPFNTPEGIDIKKKYERELAKRGIRYSRFYNITDCPPPSIDEIRRYILDTLDDKYRSEAKAKLTNCSSDADCMFFGKNGTCDLDEKLCYFDSKKGGKNLKTKKYKKTGKCRNRRKVRKTRKRYQ